MKTFAKLLSRDGVSEWLRRQPRHLLGFPAQVRILPPSIHICPRTDVAHTSYLVTQPTLILRLRLLKLILRILRLRCLTLLNTVFYRSYKNYYMHVLLLLILFLWSSVTCSSFCGHSCFRIIYHHFPHYHLYYYYTHQHRHLYYYCIMNFMLYDFT